MACPAINSGSQFLSTALAHIDCQAQYVGSYGYGALADPGSAISIALTGLLTVFVALFGMRLLGGYVADGREAMSDFLKLGIVLLLATSWPAWRVIGYDLVLDAPAEIVHAISGGPGSPLTDDNLRQRLQRADDGLVAITSVGSGRQPGADMRDEFRGMAVADETGFAWGRVIFLVGVISPYAIVRLGAGILLCLAPLLAAALLFTSSRSLFHGWLRGLAFAMLGSLAITLLQQICLAIFEPWIGNVMAMRRSGALTPSAPTEMAVMSIVFAATSIGTLMLFAKLTFLPYFNAQSFVRGSVRPEASIEFGRTHLGSAAVGSLSLSRATVTADSVSAAIRREKAGGVRGLEAASSNHSMSADLTERDGSGVHKGDILGSKYRRDYRRSATSLRRDQKL